MTVFAIHDASLETTDKTSAVVGCLFYIASSKRFYIELVSGLDKWDAPPLFHGRVKKKEYSIDHELSLKWVRQRIVPSERQNISAVLRDNKLKEYDEYRLLMLSCGRCAQDDCYIVKISEEDIPADISKRLSGHVRDVMPLSARRALVFFEDGLSKTIDLGKLLGKNIIFKNVLDNDEIFERMKVSPGGFGIEWDSDRFVPASQLYVSGELSGISYEDVLGFARLRLVDTSDVMDRLGVSRQYVDQLVKQDRLNPVISKQGVRVYPRAEIEKGV